MEPANKLEGDGQIPAAPPTPSAIRSEPVVAANKAGSSGSKEKWYRQPSIIISLIGTTIALVAFVNSLISLRKQEEQSKRQQIFSLLRDAYDKIDNNQQDEASLDLAEAKLLVQELGPRTPGSVLMSVGILEGKQGHYEEAKALFQQALAVRQTDMIGSGP